MRGQQDGIGLGALRLIRAALAGLVLSAAPASAGAAERDLSITSFERVRVEGTFVVRVATGRPPAARVSGDATALDRLDVRVEGTTLIVRRRPSASGEAPARATKITVTVATPRLVSANLTGGGSLAITGPLGGQRIDLSVNGSGALSATGLATDQLNATLVGTGALTLGGKAQRAQLVANGAGTITADALQAGDLTIRQDGSGTIRAAARYTAKASSTGLGQIAVAGRPACSVRALGGGTIACGD